MTYSVLNPFDGPRYAAFEGARRPVNLRGLVLGIIDNGKTNSGYILHGIACKLKEIYGISYVVHIKKPWVSRPITEEIAQDLAGKCQVAVAGIGD